MRLLAPLREQAAREQVANAQKQRSEDAAFGSVIADSMPEAMRRNLSRPSRKPPPASLPARAQRLRTAARLPPIPEHRSFACVVSSCVAELRAQLGELYTPELASLDSFCIYDESGNQRKALNCIRRFVGGLDNVLEQARGLVLYGPCGTGKDHLLAACLYAAAFGGIPAAFVSGEDLFLRIRDSMDTNEEEQKILGKYLRPAVLGISDPVSPHGVLKEWDARVLVRLIDSRYRARRPTWLTMNAKNEKEAAEALTEQIWDRLRDGAEILPCFWQSHRELKSKPVPNKPIAAQIRTA